MRPFGVGGSLRLGLTFTLLLVSLPAVAQDAGPTVAGCPLFPPDSIWNTRVDSLPVHPRSASYVSTIGQDPNAPPGLRRR